MKDDALKATRSSYSCAAGAPYDPSLEIARFEFGSQKESLRLRRSDCFLQNAGCASTQSLGASLVLSGLFTR